MVNIVYPLFLWRWQLTHLCRKMHWKYSERYFIPPWPSMGVDHYATGLVVCLTSTSVLSPISIQAGKTERMTKATTRWISQNAQNPQKVGLFCQWGSLITASTGHSCSRSLKRRISQIFASVCTSINHLFECVYACVCVCVTLQVTLLFREKWRLKSTPQISLVLTKMLPGKENTALLAEITGIRPFVKGSQTFELIWFGISSFTWEMKNSSEWSSETPTVSLLNWMIPSSPFSEPHTTREPIIQGALRNVILLIKECNSIIVSSN